MRMMFTNKLPALIIILLIAIFSIVLTILIDGLIAALVVGIFIITILFIAKKVWLPSDNGRIRVRSMSLWIIAGLASTNSLWSSLISSIFSSELIPWLNKNGIDVNDSIVNPTISIAGLSFALFGIFIVNYFNSDKTVMGIATSKQKEEFPERSFNEQLLGLKRVLENSLRDIDLETNWSDEFFVPLEAEVEIKSDTRQSKKVTNLISALKRNNKEKALLVLGDPGSGKSVALRKLSKDLLSEVEKTGKIPLYINLREWEVRDSEPRISDLQDFILNNIKNRCDVFASEFLNKYFDRLVQSGRIFFILDSFDEIPAILDEDESSYLIDSYSSVIYNFLDGSTDSRGILSSRIFRKPTQKFKTKTCFEIRPFSEGKILQRFEKSVNYNSDIRKLLFKERPEFVSLARNPFTASLIFNYAMNNSNTLPVNRMDLYKDHISRQLDIARRHPPFSNFNMFDDILEISSNIAYYMYASREFGLEIPINKIKAQFPSLDIDKVVEILLFIRLGRLGSGERKLFSFVHRRFNEFLIALKYSKSDAPINLDSIPSDSRWRDALVLYCEISDDLKAKEIAEYCWKVIKEVKNDKINITDESYLRSIHALRFLSEAFKARKELLDGFVDELAEHLTDNVGESNLLVSKLFVESTGILKETDSEKIIKKAFDIGNSWVSETAIRSCRNLPRISDELENQIRNYVLNLTFYDYYKRSGEFIFSFSLSDGFKKTHKLCKRLKFENSCLFAGWCISFILDPFLIIILSTLYLFSTNLQFFANYSPETKKSDNKKKTDNEAISDTQKTEILNRLEANLSNVRRSAFVFRLSLSLSVASFLSFFADFQGSTAHFFQESLSPIFIGLQIMVSLLVFPYIDFHILLLRIRKINLKTWLFPLLVILSIVFLISIYAIFIPDHIRDVLRKFIGVIFLIALTGALLISLYYYYQDRRALSSLILHEKIERAALYELLRNYKTLAVRGMIIDKIERESIKLVGSWPEELPPKINSESAIILAKMEEKNLGFDR